jgi:hypothetical protein
MSRFHLSIIFTTFLISLPFSKADESIRIEVLDKKVYDALREVHNIGADLYNENDASGCYRMFQGTLKLTRNLLDHRPALQKMIDRGLNDAEKMTSVPKRAFVLHELIEKVRLELRDPLKSSPKEGPKTEFSKASIPLPELLYVQPRELSPTKAIAEATATRTISELKITSGVGGKVVYQGKVLPGVEVTFVSRDQPQFRIFETTSDNDGIYRLEQLHSGKYTVLLRPSKQCVIQSLPERYATTTTSPLIVEIKSGGDSMDFVLR